MLFDISVSGHFTILHVIFGELVYCCADWSCSKLIKVDFELLSLLIICRLALLTLRYT